MFYYKPLILLLVMEYFYFKIQATILEFCISQFSYSVVWKIDYCDVNFRTVPSDIGKNPNAFLLTNNITNIINFRKHAVINYMKYSAVGNVLIYNTYLSMYFQNSPDFLMANV